MVASYVAFLHSNNFAPSTICSHLSAISYYHSTANFPDPCDTSIIGRMTLGCKKLCHTSDGRLPLLHSHIGKLISANDILLSHSPYLKHLYRAIMLLTFFGFFRMGELLPSCAAQSQHVLQFKHIFVRARHIHILLYKHKTNKSGKPVNIHIPSQEPMCPVRAISEYIHLRGNHDGPLFVSSLSEPLTLAAFRAFFKDLLNFCELPSARYSLHSFRIGACTQAVFSGIPHEQIMRMGRWKSHAYKRYIRVPNLSLPKH